MRLRETMIVTALSVMLLPIIAGSQEVNREALDDSDLLNLSSGAVILSHSSQSSEQWAALLVLDDDPQQGWATAQGAAFPHEVLIELAGLTRLQSIAFDNEAAQESGYPGISARAIEVWRSIEGPETGFTKALDVEATQGARSEFAFEGDVTARWIKLVVRSNWGNGSYTELMELEATGTAVSVPSDAPELSGVYRTNYGLMLFEQDGMQVSGCYDWDNGSLSGNTEGRVVQFEWREDDGKQIGSAIMVLSASGEALNGLWYENGVYRGLWIGTRAREGERPSCSPETEGVLERSLNESGRAIVYGIRFDLDSDRIRPDSEATLQEILGLLGRQAGLELIVEGHTDSSGNDAYNLDLSQRRAQSVVGWLTARGIEVARLEPRGHGESQPVAGNETSQGRALNRRVELRRRD